MGGTSADVLSDHPALRSTPDDRDQESDQVTVAGFLALMPDFLIPDGGHQRTALGGLPFSCRPDAVKPGLAAPGRYRAIITGSSWRTAVSGSRCQFSSRPNKAMPR